MPDPTLFHEGERPSAIGTVLRRAYRRVPARANFVRPAAQSADIEFGCPRCGESLAVPASQAGKKARCRHCYAPIRIARPAHQRPALDLSHDLDPLAHPEGYPLCGHRATAVDYIPRSAITALPLLSMVALLLALIAVLPKGDAVRGAVTAAYQATPLATLTSQAVEAEAVVASFLSAPDWTLRVGQVHAGLDFAGQIEALSGQLPASGFDTTSKLNEDGSATVRVSFKDGTTTQFEVASFDGEDLIVWNRGSDTLPPADYSRMVGEPELEPK